MLTSRTRSFNKLVINKIIFPHENYNSFFLHQLLTQFIYCHTKFEQNEFICILIPHPPFQIFHMGHHGLRFGMVFLCFIFHINVEQTHVTFDKMWTNSSSLKHLKLAKSSFDEKDFGS